MNFNKIFGTAVFSILIILVAFKETQKKISVRILKRIMMHFMLPVLLCYMTKTRTAGRYTIRIN